jgi:hypothetical protein
LVYDKYSKKYGFIDDTLGTKIPFRYVEALSFDNDGFAKVKRYSNHVLTDFLIDTLGNEYKVATDIKQLDSTITALDLRNKKLDTIFPAICRQKQLKVLLISNNRIQNLPDSIGQLTNLQTVNLSSNKLTSLPVEVGKWTKLQFLSLYRNELTSLPVEVGKWTKLQSLELANNQLTSLPVEVGKWTKLQWLYLSDNKLTSLPAEVSNWTAPQIKKDLANNLNSIAWDQLLEGKFAEAEATLRRGIALDSANLYLPSNLPLSLLLQGKYEAAEKEYRRLKDKPFRLLGLSFFKDAFLQDLKEFKFKGRIPKERQPDVEKIKQLLR